MRSSIRGIATLATAVALAACSGGTTTPTTAANPPASEAPAATTGGTSVCADSTGTTTVEATVGDFQWAPVTAKVGDVITWTNSDSAPHKVGLDDGSCTMSGNIPGGGKASLTFSVAGTYPFHCTIHPNMKGTITITQ
jgi:plastocyanin